MLKSHSSQHVNIDQSACAVWRFQALQLADAGNKNDYYPSLKDINRQIKTRAYPPKCRRPLGSTES